MFTPRPRNSCESPTMVSGSCTNGDLGTYQEARSEYKCQKFSKALTSFGDSSLGRAKLDAVVNNESSTVVKLYFLS